jgi:branched-chain amino acid transport system permease protein
VLGGLGSVGGAVVGALFVTALPLVLAEYSGSLPFMAAPGSGGLDPSTASRIVYGLAIIAVLIFLRGGLAGAARRLRHRAARTPAPPPAGRSPNPSTQDDGRPAEVTPSRSKETTP